MSLLHPQKNRTYNNTQSGNILVYILGALFLLGLLVVMVKGSTSPGAGIDRETLELRVNEVQSYGNELERAVIYVLKNGFSESDIRFAHPNADSAYGDITDTPTRQIFAQEGGGATYRETPTDVQTINTDWFFTGVNAVGSVGSGDQGVSSKTELIVTLPYVTKDFCMLLNKKNNIVNSGSLSDPPQDVATMATNNPGGAGFIGDFTLSTIINDASTDIQNQLEGCVEGDTIPPTGTYHYYRVLLAR